MTQITISQPIPEKLREALSKVLVRKRDYAKVATEEGMASISTIRDLMIGANVTERSYNTARRLVELAKERCDEFVDEFEELKTVFEEYVNENAA